MYTPAQIASITGANYQSGTSPEPAIRHYVIDSRKLIFPGSSIFFAIKSPKRDGHQFIEDLYHAGVRAFVVRSNFDCSTFPEAHFILNDSALEVLQKLSKHHVGRFALPRIVITGSNGKTIVKEWLFQMLKTDHHIVRSPASFNSQIGVPLSALQIEDAHDLGIFEAGISTRNEMEQIAEILQGNIGIFLNLGTAHDKGFTDKDEKLQEKLKLFKYAETLIYCSDQKKVHKAISKLNIPELLSWGKDADANPYFHILSSEKHREDFVVIRGKSEYIDYRIELPYSSDMDIENLMPIVVYMIHVGYSEGDINSRLKTIQKIPLRLELRKGLKNTILINDAYSNDLESLQSGLAFLKQQAGLKEKILVLTSFQQVNQDNESLFKAIVTLLKKYKIGFLAGLGDGISNLQSYLPADIQSEYYPDSQSLLENLLLTDKVKDKAILFKGSRHFELEKTIDKLSQLRHRTRLEIDLQALSHNISLITGHLKPHVKIMAMLKAFGYGTGEIELARFFETIRVDYLGLAYIDEGVKVRQSGVQLPIMIMNPDMDQWEQLIEFQLEPVIYTLSQLDRLQKPGHQDHIWPIHIKLDTGMHRLGFMEAEIEALIWELKATPKYRVQSIFTHLAASEDEAADEFTMSQISRFNAMYEQISQFLGYNPDRHALNSAGTIRFPDQQMDMVRLGIGMYGVQPELSNLSLEPVHTLKATISQIKTIPAGDTVGYNRQWKAERLSKVATISIGYADGLMRVAGMGRHHVLLNEHLVPLIGRVCMDMCFIDVTDLNCNEGDEVIIFGKSPTLEQLARACHTSSYEVLSRLSGRVQRVFLNY